MRIELRRIGDQVTFTLPLDHMYQSIIITKSPWQETGLSVFYTMPKKAAPFKPRKPARTIGEQDPDSIEAMLGAESSNIAVGDEIIDLKSLRKSSGRQLYRARPLEEIVIPHELQLLLRSYEFTTRTMEYAAMLVLVHALWRADEYDSRGIKILHSEWEECISISETWAKRAQRKLVLAGLLKVRRKLDDGKPSNRYIVDETIVRLLHPDAPKPNERPNNGETYEYHKKPRRKRLRNPDQNDPFNKKNKLEVSITVGGQPIQSDPGDVEHYDPFDP